MPRRSPSDKPLPRQPQKGCLFAAFGVVMIVMAIGAVKVVADFAHDNPTLFRVIAVTVLSIVAGLLAWVVARWVRGRRERKDKPE